MAETPIRGSELLRWDNAYRSFSGADLLVTAYVDGRLLYCDNMSAISYSIHREKVNVPTLGRSYALRRTRGMRTIAGSISWVVKDRHPLWQLLGEYTSDPKAFQHLPLSDSMPPFDATLTYMNEYGNASVMRIYGIDITDEGQVHSTQDMITENVMQYQAFDIDIMVPLSTEDIPWEQTTNGIFYRNIAKVVQDPAKMDRTAWQAYKDLQRSMTWLTLLYDDWATAAYNYWIVEGSAPANYLLNVDLPAVKSILDFIASTAAEADATDILILGTPKAAEISAKISTIAARLRKSAAELKLYWNVTGMREDIANGTVTSSLPFDYSIYNFE